jgi:hypothetical protein
MLLRQRTVGANGVLVILDAPHPTEIKSKFRYRAYYPSCAENLTLSAIDLG